MDNRPRSISSKRSHTVDWEARLRRAEDTVLLLKRREFLRDVADLVKTHYSSQKGNALAAPSNPEMNRENLESVMPTLISQDNNDRSLTKKRKYRDESIDSLSAKTSNISLQVKTVKSKKQKVARKGKSGKRSSSPDFHVAEPLIINPLPEESKPSKAGVVGDSSTLLPDELPSRAGSPRAKLKLRKKAKVKEKHRREDKGKDKEKNEEGRKIEDKKRRREKKKIESKDRKSSVGAEETLEDGIQFLSQCPATPSNQAYKTEPRELVNKEKEFEEMKQEIAFLKQQVKDQKQLNDLILRQQSLIISPQSSTAPTAIQENPLKEQRPDPGPPQDTLNSNLTLKSPTEQRSFRRRKERNSDWPEGRRHSIHDFYRPSGRYVYGDHHRSHAGDSYRPIYDDGISSRGYGSQTGSITSSSLRYYPHSNRSNKW